MSNKKIKVLFLDRDGVINHDPGDYTKSLSEFKILPGVVEFLIQATKSGYSIVIITNQGGIAKGKYSFEDFFEIDNYLKSVLIDNGINYLETYFCPHHDIISHCLCRKPKSGMVEKAVAKFNVDVEASIMIGDKWRDLDAAMAAGVKGIKTDVNQDLRTLDWKP